MGVPNAQMRVSDLRLHHLPERALRWSLRRPRSYCPGSNEDMTWQHAYRTDDGMKLLTGGLSSNEYAFDVLGWDDPHDITAELAALGSNLP